MSKTITRLSGKWLNKVMPMPKPIAATSLTSKKNVSFHMLKGKPSEAPLRDTRVPKHVIPKLQKVCNCGYHFARHYKKGNFLKNLPIAKSCIFISFLVLGLCNVCFRHQLIVKEQDLKM